jgi:dipeptidyl-peptidase-4
MKNNILSGLACAALAGLANFPAHADSGGTVPIDAYRRAELMQGSQLADLGLNLDVVPIWLPTGERFWFKEQSAAGWTYIEVDPAGKTRHTAFDHQRLAVSINKHGGNVDAGHLPLADLAVTDNTGRHVTFTLQNRHWQCDLQQPDCSVTDRPARTASVVVSPTGTLEAFVRDRNLWVRDSSGGHERQLTRDGEAHYEYGKMPDSSLLAVQKASSGREFPPYGIYWSPDGRYLVVSRTDERKVPDYTFLQALPSDGTLRPRPITIRTPLSAEPDLASLQVSVIEVASGAVHKLDTGPLGLSASYWWSGDCSHFLALQGGDYSRQEILFDVGVASGRMRRVLSEESPTFLQVSPLEYDEPAVRYLPATDELVWFSQRDGWNHLYLLDVRTGRVKAQLGAGNWSVQNIVHIDEAGRRIYFTAAGREAGQDPYFRHLYSVGLDGHGLRLLTPEAADHVFAGAVNPALRAALEAFGLYNESPSRFSPGGRYFIDTWSTIATPPVTVLRASADGHVVMQLATADVSAIRAQGWIAPEAFHAKAADGETDLYGLFIKPADFNPAKRYPVIEHIYNGPQIVTTPHDFAKGLTNWMARDAQSLAQLGFVVVVMDGRGTPMRSKAFQDYIYNNMQEFSLEDHVAALKSLASRSPFMDIGRLGVFGHSFGGYTAMKAILGYPDFYKVAAASAGPYDMYAMYPLDAFFQPPVFGGAGAAAREPTNWGKVDLTRQAGQLRGKLLLAYGDLDENALPATSVRMVNALIAANKEFDLIYMPNRSHAFEAEPYFIRRRWDFFVRNLLGAEPPKDYEFTAAK